MRKAALTCAALGAAILPYLADAPSARAQSETPPSIEQLLSDGWKVAGYVAQGTTFILFSHPDRKYLVQCSVLYDTTRGTKWAERVRTNCYELH